MVSWVWVHGLLHGLRYQCPRPDICLGRPAGSLFLFVAPSLRLLPACMRASGRPRCRPVAWPVSRNCCMPSCLGRRPMRCATRGMQAAFAVCSSMPGCLHVFHTSDTLGAHKGMQAPRARACMQQRAGVGCARAVNMKIKVQARSCARTACQQHPVNHARSGLLRRCADAQRRCKAA